MPRDVRLAILSRGGGVAGVAASTQPPTRCNDSAAVHAVTGIGARGRRGGDERASTTVEVTCAMEPSQCRRCEGPCARLRPSRTRRPSFAYRWAEFGFVRRCGTGR